MLDPEQDHVHSIRLRKLGGLETVTEGVGPFRGPDRTVRTTGHDHLVVCRCEVCRCLPPLKVPGVEPERVPDAIAGFRRSI
jgi:hypothetical protein